jgi:hypothetical protein
MNGQPSTATEEELEDIRRRVAEIHGSVDPKRFPMWTVYGPGTSDHPGRFVARLFWSIPKPEPTNAVVRSGNLDELRSLLPPGLCPVPRDPSDDPNILETWI